MSPPTQDKFSKVCPLSRDNISQVSPAPQDKSHHKISSPSKVSVATKQDNFSQTSPSPKDDFSNPPSLAFQSQDSYSQVLPPLPCNFTQTSQLSSNKSSQVSQSSQSSLPRQENFSQALPISQDKSLPVFSESHTASGHTQFSSAQKSGPVHRKSQRKPICTGKVERMWLRSRTLCVTTASGCRSRRTPFETANAKESWIRRRFLEEEDVRTRKKDLSFPLSLPAGGKQRQHDARLSTAARSGGKEILTPLRRRRRRSSQQTLSPKGASKLRQARRKKYAKHNSPLQVDGAESLRSLSGKYGKQTSQCARTISEQPETEDRRGKSTDGKERFKCLKSTDGKERFKCLRSPEREDKRQAKQMTEGICKRRGRPRKKDAKQTLPKQTSVLRQQAKGKKRYIEKLDTTDIQAKKRSTLRPRNLAVYHMQRRAKERNESAEKTGQKRTMTTKEGATRKRGRPRKDNCEQTDFPRQLIRKKRRTSRSVVRSESCSFNMDISNSTKKMDSCTRNLSAEKCDGEDGLTKHQNLSRKHRFKQRSGCEDSTAESQPHEKHRRERVPVRPPVQCEYCGLCLCHRDSLLFHIAAHHTNNRPFKCDHCEKSFVTRFKLKCHLNSKHAEGGRRFKCSKCTFKAYDSRTLKVHQLTHSNEKPYRCSECADAFTRLYYLRTHMRTHTGEKPFKCNDCLRSFSQSCSLTRHKRICQGMKSEGPHREQDQPPSASVVLSTMPRKDQGNAEIVLVRSLCL